jgi:DNA-binding NarL/FixJ family response regulator
MREEEREPGLGKGEDHPGTYFEKMLASYARTRGLSDRQERILRLHLGGTKNKEIGSLCGCAETTVHEHWRRMARKIGGRYQEEVLADFHRFLGARGSG